MHLTMCWYSMLNLAFFFFMLDTISRSAESILNYSHCLVLAQLPVATASDGKLGEGLGTRLIELCTPRK